jgi:hypothetical protein
MTGSKVLPKFAGERQQRVTELDVTLWPHWRQAAIWRPTCTWLAALGQPFAHCRVTHRAACT